MFTVQCFCLINCKNIDTLKEKNLLRIRKDSQPIEGVNDQFSTDSGDLKDRLALQKPAIPEKLANIDDDLQNIEQEWTIQTSNQQQVQKCQPMLNIPISGVDTYSASTDLSTTNVPQTLVSNDTSFSFAINDIEMPIVPASGSVNTAMKLLSTFDEHLSGSESSSGDVDVIENVVKFTENELRVQGLNITMLNVHLYNDDDPRFGVGVTIKNTTLTGQFTYNGPLLLTTSKLSGFYRMSIDNIYLTAASNLTRKSFTKVARNQNELSKSYHKLETNDFKLNISNLGYISIDIFDTKEARKARKTSSNYLLRMLQRVLQKTIKRTYYSFEQYIRQTLESEAKKTVNCELTRFAPLFQNNVGSNHQNDLVSRIINAEISRSRLHNVSLPEFEHKQNILGSSATIQFYNGSLSGLDSVRLNGETRLKLQNDYLFVNTSIGWKELKPYYSWSLFMGAGEVSRSNRSPLSKGHVQFLIKGIDFDTVISKGLKSHSHITVEQLLIRYLESPKMDISGLPGMNRLTRAVVNFFMGRLKQRLASSIQPVLKQQLEKTLNKIAF